MSNVVIKPLCRIETPDGPLYATSVAGVVVHGSKPMAPEGQAAMEELVRHVRRRLADEIDADCRRALSGPPKLEKPDRGFGLLGGVIGNDVC